MRFQTVNGLNLFKFEEVTIKEMDGRNDVITVVMDALIVKGHNPNNEEFTDRYADIANVRFLNGTIKEIFKEGFKYYDANDNLMEEEPDTPVSPMEYESLLKKCKDVYLFDIVALKETEGDYEYQLGIDLNESDTYWMTINCKETIVEWERFKNKVMK